MPFNEVKDGICRICNGEIVEAWRDVRLTDKLISLMGNGVALSDKR